MRSKRKRTLPEINQGNVESGLQGWRNVLNDVLAIPDAPALPLNFSAGAAAGGIQLSWAAVNGADGYELEVSTSGDFSTGTQTVPLRNAAYLSYFDAIGATPATKYYKLRATSGTTSQPHSIQGPQTTIVSATSLPTLAASNLDGVPDGSTYTRMPGANMDGARRALIDFTQGGHVAKNVDNVGDGASFQRFKLGNTLMPDIPYNGDFEQFADTAVVAEGWTKAFQTTGSPTDANYARSASAFRGNYAQNLLSGDNVIGVSVASRPFGVKEFLQYQFQVRAKIDVKPQNTDSFPGSSLSANWTVEQGTASVSGSSVGVATGGADQRFLAVRNESYPADQFAQVTCTTAPTGGNTIGVCVRGAAGAETFYAFYADNATAYLFKLVTGTLTVLAQVAQVMHVGDVLRLEVAGTQLTAKYNEAVLLTATDSSIASGAPGLQGITGGAGVAAKVGSFIGGSHGFFFRVLWYTDDSDLSNAGAASSIDIVSGGSAAFTVAAGTYQTLAGTVTAPSGARFCRIALYNWGPSKAINTATVITVDTVTVQLQKINSLVTVTGSTPGPTTSSTTYSALPEMTITRNFTGGATLLLFSGVFFIDTAGGQVLIDIFRDGVATPAAYTFTFPASLAPVTITIAHIETPSAGNHTYDVRWRTNVGTQTVTASGTVREFQLGDYAA